MQAVAAQELRRFLVVHLCQFGLDFAADGRCPGVRPAGHFIQLVFAHGRIQIVAQRGAFADVECIQNGLLREEHEALDELLLVGRHLQFAKRLLFLKRIFRAEKQRLLALQVAGAALLQVFFESIKTLFHLGQIAEHQIEFNALDVPQRVDRPHMRNGVVLEGAQHVNERVHIAQAGEEGGLFERLLPDGRHVNVLDSSVGCFLRRVERRELVQPLVWNPCHADVLFARIRVGLLFELGLGQNLE